MRNYFQIILCLCLTSNYTYGQIGSIIGSNTSTQKKVYRTYKNPSEKRNTNDVSVLSNLAQSITRNSHTETEKAEAIFKWIALNINYDNELRHDKKLQKEFYTSKEKIISKVLERRKALCGGYAFLYKSLCNQVGIEAEVVHGFSQNYSGNATRNNNPNHTWNSVKIDGKWRLLDLTLANSHGSKGKPDTYWFKTDPKYFINTHYPLEIKWTLLKNPISKWEFETLAKM